jgi:hypothetical protein
MNVWKACCVLVFGLGAAVAWMGGCSGSSGGGTPVGADGGPISGAGICQDTCPKDCAVDQDCQTSQGQLCCNYPSGGNICQDAKSCPKFCASDSTCDTTMGQACVRTSLASAQMVCEPAQVGLKLCQVDSDCVGANQVCCTIYSQGICVPANECPKACNVNSDCNTAQGDICCDSVGVLEPSLKVAGLCLNPTYLGPEACPKKCTVSSDCDATNPLCCNGICQKTCPKSCQQSSDCSGQICCKTTGQHVPSPPVIFKVGPTCQGTPAYGTCAACGSSLGCSMTGCPGCTAMAGTGSCTGFPNSPNCAYCGTYYNCQGCLGCTQEGGVGSCIGNPTYTTCAGCPSTYCGTSSSYCLGCTPLAATCTGTASYTCSSGVFTQTTCPVGRCTWNLTTMQCEGATQSCSLDTLQTDCQNDYGCSWLGGCTGTVKQCAQNLDPTSCSAESGCSWSATTSCVGNVTPCASLSAATCQAQSGCTWTGGQVTCSGNLTPCNQLTPTQCAMVPGCSLQ